MEKNEHDIQSVDEEFPKKYERKYVPGRGVNRYDNALKNLIPIRRNNKTSDENTMPIDDIGLFSMTTSSWISKYMTKGQKNSLKLEELPNVSPYDTCDYNADRLELLWKQELANKGAEKSSFSMVAWRFIRTRIFMASLVHCCNMLCGFLSFSLFMRRLLEYVQSGDGSYEEGIKLALSVTAVETTRILLWSWSNSMNYRTGIRLRSACLTLLYRQVVGVKNLQKHNIGEVVNMFSNDAQRIFETVCNAPLIIEAPITSALALYYTLWLLSPMALVGMVTFVVYYPIQYVISRLIGHYQAETFKLSDMRVRLMNEILDCIKLIKMYAWENRFSQDLLGIRKMERSVLFKVSYLQNLNVSLSPTISSISTIVTFLAHVSAGNNLTAAQAFPYAAFLDGRFRLSLMSFRLASESMVSGGISFDRIKKILLLENHECSVLKSVFKTQVLAIKKGTFAYPSSDDQNGRLSKTNNKKQKNERTSKGDESEKEELNKSKINAGYVEILFDISFEAEKGKLVGICGTVGSGKSSLLLAALGQLRVSDGQVTRDGECAYVSQQAWITNATLRENILFGAKFEEKRYNETIEACSLIQDIDMFSGGDQTEIGERGINLSGGQKQRVALARALYANRDIYLLDDPLSAVDSRVGAYIFNHLILGALKEKTVLFVTHQIQYLNRCDDVYMMRDGRIVEHGTHDDLMKLGNEYASMVAAISTDDEIEYENTEDQEEITTLLPKSPNDISLQKESPSKASTPNTIADTVEKSTAPGTSLTVAENLQRGTINADIYKSYIKAGGGYSVVFIVALMYFTSIASSAFSSWWLSLWLNAGAGSNSTIVVNNVTINSNNISDNPDLWYYESVYASTIVIILLTTALRGLVFGKATLSSSTKLHNELFKKLINFPMKFFDTTPTGRIQHLFSRDMDEVDNKLPFALSLFIRAVFKITLTITVLCMVFPWFTLPIFILAVIYYHISKTLRIAIRDLKRMDNMARAPVISLVTSTVQGLSTIHAFDKQNDFKAKFTKLFDGNSKYQFMLSTGMSWLSLRVDSLSIALTSVTAFLIIIFQNQVSPALAGLALAFSAQISGVLSFFMRIMSETETRFTSVEKINNYIKNVESDDDTNERSVVKPESSWPADAEIKFINVSLAYRDGTPLILKNVSFTVNAGEKIGIVGRTGAGKSSLTVALFRLVELTKGKIEIDDVDISEISLNELRSKLSIIPQDPVLFSGTVRSNLDPFKLCTDAEIWDALEKTELKSRVQTLAGQLDASVGFGGDNMSVGERQLLCLARALLRNSKILVLDEATAAVDPETEKAVQNTVQQEFSHCTILIIAHRLQTVLSLNRVLVMENGEILEFDTPSNLLRDQNSEFSKMMSAAEETGNQ